MKKLLLVIGLSVILTSSFSQGSGSVTWNGNYSCCGGTYITESLPDMNGRTYQYGNNFFGPVLTSFTLNYSFTKSNNSIVLNTSLAGGSFDNKIFYDNGAGSAGFQLFTNQQARLNESRIVVNCEVYYNGALIDIPGYKSISCEGNKVFAFDQATADKFPVAKQARDNNYNGTWEIRNLGSYLGIENDDTHLSNCQSIKDDFVRYIEDKKNREREEKAAEAERKKQEAENAKAQEQAKPEQDESPANPSPANNNQAANNNNPPEKKGRSDAETQALLDQYNALIESDKQREQNINQAVGDLTNVAMAVGDAIAEAHADNEAYKAEIRTLYSNMLTLRDQNKLKSELDLWTEKDNILNKALYEAKIKDVCVFDLTEYTELHPEFYMISFQDILDKSDREGNALREFGLIGNAQYENVYNKNKSMVAFRLFVSNFKNLDKHTYIKNVLTGEDILILNSHGNTWENGTSCSFSDNDSLLVYQDGRQILIYSLKPAPILLHNLLLKKYNFSDASIVNNDILYKVYDPNIMINNLNHKRRSSSKFLWGSSYNDKINRLEPAYCYYLSLKDLAQNVSNDRLEVEAKTINGLAISFNPDRSSCTLLENGQIIRKHNSKEEYFDFPMDLMVHNNTKDETAYNFVIRTDANCKYLICFGIYSEPDELKRSDGSPYTRIFLDGINDGFAIQLYDYQTRKFICELKPNIAALYDVKFVGNKIEVMGLDKAGLYGFFVYKSYDINTIVGNYQK